MISIVGLSISIRYGTICTTHIDYLIIYSITTFSVKYRSYAPLRPLYTAALRGIPMIDVDIGSIYTFGT